MDSGLDASHRPGMTVGKTLHHAASFRRAELSSLTPSPLVGEGRGGGYGRVRCLGLTPLPSSPPQGGRERLRSRWLPRPIDAGFYFRHCERSEAIQNLSAKAVWIASSLTLLAMTVGKTLHHAASFWCRELSSLTPSPLVGEGRGGGRE